jgi:RNA polymerase sigma factor (TIGR02999 family)
MTQSAQLTRVIRAINEGDPKAAAELLPLVYTELRKLARSLMAKTPPGNTFQTTALVHEAYLRLVGNEDPGWNGRGHFFAAAAQAMRQILVDQARRKSSVKHGGGRRRVEAGDWELPIETPQIDILALNEALERLEREEPRKARIVMLRYFAGLSEEETAAVLDLSLRTIQREWRFARALLFTQLWDGGMAGHESEPDLR